MRALPAALLFVLASPAVAQTVTGRVLIEGGERTASGAWVILTDSTGVDRMGALANAQGQFVARAPFAGRYTVRAQLIGHETATEGPLELVPGRVAEVEFRLRPRPLPLEAISVEAERRCATRPDGGAAAAVWDEVRKVLTAVQWTGRHSLVTYRIRHYQETRDLRGRRVEGVEDTVVRRAERPFTTPPPEELARNGYVQRDGDGSIFYAPDADVLLSDAFAGSHCFRVRRGTGDEAGLVGLTFEPSGTSLPDVEGTLWIDALTSALRFLEYRYTGIDYGARTRELGGRLEFGRLPSGAWIIERWWIRGPAFEARAGVSGRSEAVLAGFKLAGAEVVRVLDYGGRDAADRDTVSRPRAAAAPGTPRERDAADLPPDVLSDIAYLQAAIIEEGHGTGVEMAAVGTEQGRLMNDGFAALERFLHARSRADHVTAREAFERAIRTARASAVAQFGLGLTHALGPELAIAGADGYQHRRAYVQTNAELAARRALLAAVHADARLQGAAVALAHMALATRDPNTLLSADSALLLAGASSDAAVLVAASDVALARNEIDRAIVLARHAVELGGGPAAQHTLGSALLLSGLEREGAAAYLGGLSDPDDVALLRYWDDARFVLRRAEIGQWSVLPRDERGAWLRERWDRLAAASAIPVAERLRLHMERLAHAHRAFRRQSFRGAPPEEKLILQNDTLDSPFDERGLLYVRHGAPHQIIRTPPVRNLPPNETWVYQDGGPPSVFHFFKLEANSDWQITGGLDCDPFLFRFGVGGLRGEREATQAIRAADADQYMDGYLRWHNDRLITMPAGYGPMVRCLGIARSYESALARTGNGQLAVDSVLPDLRYAQADFRVEAAERRREASQYLTTEHAAPDLARPIHALTALYAFRGEDRRTDVAATVLVPASEFTPAPMADGVRYAIRTSVTLVDSTGAPLARVDTVQAYAAVARVDAERWVRTNVMLQVEPNARVTTRMLVRNADRIEEGQLSVGERAVPDYGGEALMLSDLVVAEPGEGRLVRGAARLNPVPTHQIHADSAFLLYYEIYNLAPDAQYETRIRIEPVSSGVLSRIAGLFGRKNGIDLRFDDVAPTDTGGRYGTPSLRSITASLEPGRYRLRVTVRDANGAEAAVEAVLVLFE